MAPKEKKKVQFPDNIPRAPRTRYPAHPAHPAHPVFTADTSTSQPVLPVIPEHDLPLTVVYDHKQDNGSILTSMDFHPSAQTLLLVGWRDGVLDIWDIGIQKKLSTEAFKIWDALHDKIGKNSSFCITQVKWSDEGGWAGVATTKRLVHIYEFGERKLTPYREIDAHKRFVNDLAFCHLNEKLVIVTCGDDKFVKVWGLDGRQLRTCDATSPVICVCPHTRQNIEHVLFSCNRGETKDWRYTNVKFQDADDFVIAEYGNVYGTFQYSADGKRLFSCGANKDGGHLIREWDQDKRTIKEEYSGLVQKSDQKGVVHFDTTQSQFLALGEDRQINFFDMNTMNVFVSTNADGELSKHPRLRFNEEENLLAVSARNGFKILANIKGLASLKGVDQVKCQVVTLPKSADPASKVARLLYTKSGDGILVLGSDGIQRLWKWGHSEQNPTPKATASVIPRLWQPSSGLLMINDISDVNLEAVPWIVLSKDDSCVMSAAGGRASLFNMMTFEVLTRFMPLPPASASTVVAFHPIDKKIIAFGMENSIILIYDVILDRVVEELSGGHVKRITGLAFSENLKILVSSGADIQLCTWGIHKWDPRTSVPLEYLPKKVSQGNTREKLVPQGDTHVQFHSDQIHLLVWHKSLLARYDATEMQCKEQWVPQGELSAPISFGAYSSDCLVIYAAFHDGNVGVFDSETLTLRCHISPSAYLGSQVPPIAYPLVLATHPNKPNQLAVGFTDGSVHVIEPSDRKRWGEGDGIPSVAVAGGILTAPAPAGDVVAPAAPDVAVPYRPLRDFFFFGNKQKQKKR